jgi:hypothetical protein
MSNKFKLTTDLILLRFCGALNDYFLLMNTSHYQFLSTWTWLSLVHSSPCLLEWDFWHIHVHKQTAKKSESHQQFPTNHLSRAKQTLLHKLATENVRRQERRLEITVSFCGNSIQSDIQFTQLSEHQRFPEFCRNYSPTRKSSSRVFFMNPKVTTILCLWTDSSLQRSNDSPSYSLFSYHFKKFFNTLLLIDHKHILLYYT